jgi:hypothetical protein
MAVVNSYTGRVEYFQGDHLGSRPLHRAGQLMDIFLA